MMDKSKRWVCPQCFSSARSTINTYKSKPDYNCPDHFNIEYVEVVSPIDSK